MSVVLELEEDACCFELEDLLVRLSNGYYLKSIQLNMGTKISTRRPNDDHVLFVNRVARRSIRATCDIFLDSECLLHQLSTTGHVFALRTTALTKDNISNLQSL